MGVYKEGKNWKVQVYYRDWQGNRKRKQKRGFRTKGEAKEWERDFLQQQTQSVDIEFGNFLELYYKDMEVRLRENTMYTKRYIIDLKIKPYFEHKVLSEITVADMGEYREQLSERLVRPGISGILHAGLCRYLFRTGQCDDHIHEPAWGNVFSGGIYGRTGIFTV